MINTAKRSIALLLLLTLQGAALITIAPKAEAVIPADWEMVSLTSEDIDRAIPDDGFTEDFLGIGTVGTIVDVNFGVRISHAHVSDLEIGLYHADEVAYGAYQHGGSGDNFGSGNTDCTGTFTYFDDGAATPIETGFPPWAGHYQPWDNLNADYMGKRANGQWRLAVFDSAAGTSGILHCWRLDVIVDTDTDDDGFTDEAEIKMGSDRRDPAEPVVHKRRVTLDLTGHLRASGRVSMKSGFPSFPKCTKGIQVKIEKSVAPFGFTKVAAPSTDDEAKYSKELDDIEALYRSKVAKKVVKAAKVHVCPAATSLAWDHEHGGND